MIKKIIEENYKIINYNKNLFIRMILDKESMFLLFRYVNISFN